MGISCYRCGSNDFHASHFRWKDVRHLFVLEYPARCRKCHNRQYVSVAAARKLPGSRRRSKDMASPTL